MRLTAIALCLLLSGCFTGYSYIRPHVKPPSKAAKKPVTYRQCDKTGCRVYDSRGNRRYDLER